MKRFVLAIALGEESLGRGHLEPGGPPVSLVDAGPDPHLLGDQGRLISEARIAP